MADKETLEQIAELVDDLAQKKAIAIFTNDENFVALVRRMLVGDEKLAALALRVELDTIERCAKVVQDRADAFHENPVGGYFDKLAADILTLAADPKSES